MRYCAGSRTGVGRCSRDLRGAFGAIRRPVVIQFFGADIVKLAPTIAEFLIDLLRWRRSSRAFSSAPTQVRR